MWDFVDYTKVYSNDFCYIYLFALCCISGEIECLKDFKLGKERELFLLNGIDSEYDISKEFDEFLKKRYASLKNANIDWLKNYSLPNPIFVYKNLCDLRDEQKCANEEILMENIFKEDEKKEETAFTFVDSDLRLKNYVAKCTSNIEKNYPIILECVQKKSFKSIYKTGKKQLVRRLVIDRYEEVLKNDAWLEETIQNTDKDSDIATFRKTPSVKKQRNYKLDF